MDDKVSQGAFVSVLAEAAHLVRRVAGPGQAGDSVKSALRRAFRRLRTWRFSRVRAVWYSDVRISISGDELNQLRAAARVAEAEHRDPELAEIIARVAATEARLARLDAEFFLPDAEGRRAATRPVIQSSDGSSGLPDPGDRS